MARFKPGDLVRVWKPGRAEHGCSGCVAKVVSVREYGGSDYPLDRGPHAYYPTAQCWKWPQEGWGALNGGMPDAMLVSEEEFQKSVRRR